MSKGSNPAGPGPFKCPYRGSASSSRCDKEFVWVGSLRDHVVTKHHVFLKNGSLTQYYEPTRRELEAKLEALERRHGAPSKRQRGRSLSPKGRTNGPSTTGRTTERSASREGEPPTVTPPAKHGLPQVRSSMNALAETKSTSSTPPNRKPLSPLQRSPSPKKHRIETVSVTPKPAAVAPTLARSDRETAPTPLEAEIGAYPAEIILTEITAKDKKTKDPRLAKKRKSTPSPRPAVPQPNVGSTTTDPSMTSPTVTGVLDELEADLQLSSTPTSRSGSSSCSTTPTSVESTPVRMPSVLLEEAIAGWVRNGSFIEWLHSTYPAGPCKYCLPTEGVCRECLAKALEDRFNK